MNYWLMKSEPDVFGIDHLAERPDQTEPWDGVRNYQARNMLRDQMKVGDQIFFYHSNCKVPGIVGIAEVAREGYPDHTAFDPECKYYDPASDPEKPRWYMVDVRLKRKLARVISLEELKARPELADMPLVRRGNRLSVMPVTPEQWRFILSLEHAE
ncbi:EVE domain-containing protein [Ectothiorhodospiraceae bacterium 2226]|nr:EVE domain-containing protein [Ectothiorhodospiraceae bacterium 2226]